MLAILALIGFGFGIYLGVIRFNLRKAKELRIEKAKSTPKPRKTRIDVSEDAPAELTQAELKAMGKWFNA